ncbi:hypothetical protein LEP1GSC061_0459 [Leptospira wolffii serovar Khorat str. Khorat-H2]|nr:hypothetical protein LEP1GSC061_0459 [Leptospira wolffii serovar Khorat str. Khorat-H2]
MAMEKLGKYKRRQAIRFSLSIKVAPLYLLSEVDLRFHEKKGPYA